MSHLILYGCRLIILNFKLSYSSMGKTYPNTNNSNLNRIANSAPLPNQTILNSRSGSSLAVNNSAYQQYNYEQKAHNQAKNPIIMRNVDKQYQQVSAMGVHGYHTGNNGSAGSGNPVLYRPISANELRSNSKPVFGRKQFNNQTNMTANLAAKNLFGNYSQSSATITANGLNSLKKWW